MIATALRRCIAAGAMVCLTASGALAHPHIFAEASLDVVVSPDRQSIAALRHLWRFDELFSSTVILEFDKNGDGKLDATELEAVRETVFKSLAEYNYFQLVTIDGKDVAMTTPDQFIATFEDNQLIIMFEARPAAVLKAAGRVDIGIYDPTFYTAIDFIEDKSMKLSAELPGCAAKVVRPDPDEVIASNSARLDEAFFNDPAGNDMTKLFATRLEIACPPAQG